MTPDSSTTSRRQFLLRNMPLALGIVAWWWGVWRTRQAGWDREVGDLWLCLVIPVAVNVFCAWRLRTQFGGPIVWMPLVGLCAYTAVAKLGFVVLFFLAVFLDPVGSSGALVALILGVFPGILIYAIRPRLWEGGAVLSALFNMAAMVAWLVVISSTPRGEKHILQIRDSMGLPVAVALVSYQVFVDRGAEDRSYWPLAKSGPIRTGTDGKAELYGEPNRHQIEVQILKEGYRPVTVLLRKQEATNVTARCVLIGDGPMGSREESHMNLIRTGIVSVRQPLELVAYLPANDQYPQRLRLRRFYNSIDTNPSKLTGLNLTNGQVVDLAEADVAFNFEPHRETIRGPFLRLTGVNGTEFIPVPALDLTPTASTFAYCWWVAPQEGYSRSIILSNNLDVSPGHDLFVRGQAGRFYARVVVKADENRSRPGNGTVEGLIYVNPNGSRRLELSPALTPEP